MAAMNFYSTLEQLVNPTRNLGGGPGGGEQAKALAQLILEGGSADVEGQSLFGQLFETGPSAGSGQLIDAYGAPVELNPATVAPKLAPAPLRGGFQAVLESAKQMAEGLAPGSTAEKKTLVANPYGPGSYDPNNPEERAAVLRAGEQSRKVATARETLQGLAVSDIPKAAQGPIIEKLLESLGLSQSEYQKAFDIAKGKVAGEQAGFGSAGGGGVEEIAKKVASYDISIPSGFALRSPMWQAVLKRAVEINPEFDQKTYSERLKTKQDFATGRNARNIISANTAVDHLGTLKEAAVSLQNAGPQLWNLIKNTSLSAVGDDRVTAFNNAAVAVENELASLFKGTGATDQEIKQWRKNLSSSQSPEQIQKSIETAVKLLQGRVGAMEDLWKKKMGAEPKQPFLSDSAQETIDQLGVGKKPRTQAGAPEAGTVSKGYRFKGGDPSKQENWERVQ